MKRKYFWCIVSLLAALSVLLLAACAKPEQKLLGTWKTVSDGKDVYFTFQEDHTLNVNNEIVMKYAITKDRKLVLGLEGPAMFSIQGKTLRITQEAGHTILLERVTQGDVAR